MERREHFSDEFIDAIQGDPEHNYFSSVLNRVLDCIPLPQAVCDVGCGNGVFSIALKKKTNCWLVGMDGSDYALKCAARIGFEELHKIDDFSEDSLPIGDGVFDLVINKDVLEHLLHPDHLVGEIARIVRPGGHALIHVPNHFPIIGRIKLLTTNNIDPFYYFPESERWDFPHIRFFTMDALCQLFRKNGFEVVDDMNHLFFQAGKFNRLIPLAMKRALCRRNPDAWTEGYTVLFQKSRV